MEAELLKGFQREALGHKEQISVLIPRAGERSGDSVQEKVQDPSLELQGQVFVQLGLC